MNRFATIALFLFVTSLPQCINAHFFWAEKDMEADKVIVEFSENAGVADKVVAMVADRLMTMQYNGVDATYDVSMHLNDKGNLLEGDLAPPSSNAVVQNTAPYFVSGFVDYGPFERFHDIKFSFGAQVYSEDSDYDKYFRPLLKDVEDTPTIVMRNCGGSDGTSFQFDIAGFPAEGPLGVCIYQKGGIQVGCGNFDLELVKYGLVTLQLRGNKKNVEQARRKMDLSMQLNIPMSLQQERTHLYAKANKTITDEESGDVDILIATTSVYFRGPCKK